MAVVNGNFFTLGHNLRKKLNEMAVVNEIASCCGAIDLLTNKIFIDLNDRAVIHLVDRAVIQQLAFQQPPAFRRESF